MRGSAAALHRLTNAFAKTLENHVHMVNFYTLWYSVVNVRGTDRMSPAMAAGVTDRLWSVEDIAKLVEAAEPAAVKRRPYRERAA